MNTIDIEKKCAFEDKIHNDCPFESLYYGEMCINTEKEPNDKFNLVF
jgi:hypothetical protein